MIIKRIFDFTSSLLGLIILSPVFLVIAICIKLGSAGPVFFRQERIGYLGKPFNILKFRTMRGDAAGLPLTVGDDIRITKCGRFLRKFKLDELPQLINVLKGDMSLVGPRPEVPKYVAYYPEDIKKIIFSVPPGITDSAAIKFKDENYILAGSKNVEKDYIEKILPVKLKYYQDYISTLSFSSDIMLILKTIKAIIKR